MSAGLPAAGGALHDAAACRWRRVSVCQEAARRRYVSIEPVYMAMTETHVVCASDDVVFVWCARAPSNWTRTARGEAAPRL